jgi:hypothetical protein
MSAKIDLTGSHQFRHPAIIQAQNSPPIPTFFPPAQYFQQSTSSILPSSLPENLPFFVSLPLLEGLAVTFWKPSEQENFLFSSAKN